MKNSLVVELSDPVVRIVGDTLAIEINVINCTHDDVKVCDNIFLGWWHAGSCGVLYGVEQTNVNKFDMIQPGGTLTLYGDMRIGDYKGLVSIEGHVHVIEPIEMIYEVPFVSVLIK